MPNKTCCVCNRLQNYSTQDWKLISKLPEVVCSKDCALIYIKDHDEDPAVLEQAIVISIPQPFEAYSKRLTRFFRSKYEVYVAEWLHRHHITFEYETYAFAVKSQAHWTPDFYLPQYSVFLEVKGSWGTSAKSKVASFYKLYPNVPLLVVPWTLAEEFYPKKVKK